MIQVSPNKQNNLSKISSADCFQVRSLSEKRITKKIGKVDKDTLDKIKDGLAKVP
jgi:mRNA interferase MazF